MQTREPRPVEPKRWVRRAVSVGILLHFFAILTTLVGTGSYRFPAPALAAWLRHTRPIEAYLQSLFLTSPYRFYAPDPGPTNLMWFELHYADGAERWFEVARREDLPLRIPFQRHMSLTLLLGWMGLVPNAADPRKMSLTEEGKACTSSYVRHVAGMFRRADSSGAPIPVDSVTAYLVYHLILQPYQIRMNWQPDDLRLFNQTYLGTYGANGARGDDPYKPGAYNIPSNSIVFARFLVEHVEGLLRGVPETEWPAKLASLHLPTPWQNLITREPKLLRNVLAEAGGEEPTDRRVERLQKLIEEAATNRDRPLPGTAPQAKASDGHP